MLVVVQFPIADGRCFYPGETARLSVPSWPTPRFEVNAEFVRYFGPAAHRHLGANPTWFGETIYCSARRALRFPGLTDPTRSKPFTAENHPSDLYFGSPSVAFRRFFSDGANRSRVEVGLRYEPWPYVYEDEARFTTERAIANVQKALSLPTMVAGSSSTVSLVAQGAPLTELYRKASTRQGMVSAAQVELVQDGSPLAVVELQWNERVVPPSHAQVVKDARLGDTPVWFTWVRAGMGAVGTWFIGPDDWSGRANLRALRLGLLRLHVEQEALDLLLKQIERGDLPYQPRTVPGERLEDYLNSMIHALRQDSRFAIPQRELIKALATSGAGVAKDPTELLDRLKGARRQIRKQIDEYERAREVQRPIRVYTVETGGTLKVEEQNISGGNFYGPVINSIVANQIKDSLNIVQSSGAPEDLRHALESLHDEVAKALSTTSEAKAPEAEKLANALEVFSQQAVQKQPLKEVVVGAGRELIAAAKEVAVQAQPILSAVTGVLTILGMVGML